jgi:hypothetical protein
LVDAASTGLSARPAGGISASRLLLFVTIAAFMVAGPVVEQVFGARSAFWRSWTMFSAIGLGVIDVSFAVRQPGGTLVPLDRFATLGGRPGGKFKRIEGTKELTALVLQLCAALGPGADLRVTARQATREGWQVISTDERNVCAL